MTTASEVPSSSTDHHWDAEEVGVVNDQQDNDVLETTGHSSPRRSHTVVPAATVKERHGTSSFQRQLFPNFHSNLPAAAVCRDTAKFKYNYINYKICSGQL